MGCVKIRKNILPVIIRRQYRPKNNSKYNLHLQVGSLKFSKVLTLSPGETRWVSVPPGAQLQQPQNPPHSAVHISSTAHISVVAFNRQTYTSDGAVITPTDQLGVEYRVFTPAGGTLEKQLAVVNGNSPNKVTFQPTTNVKVEGLGLWKGGSAMTFALKPYQTFLVQSFSTLTGMQIKSQKPLAVFFGHKCYGAPCDHLYKQLPPVSQLSKEYMVPPGMKSPAESWVEVVATEDNTEVSVYRGKGTEKRLR